MSGEKIEIEGLAKLNRALKAMESGLDKEVATVNFEAAEIVREKELDLVPRKSGKLARSIRSGKSARGATVSAGSAAVPYAGPIIFGWQKHGISKNPFPFEALDEKRPEVIALYDERTRALLERTFA